jgi:hypothetical protein
MTELRELSDEPRDDPRSPSSHPSSAEPSNGAHRQAQDAEWLRRRLLERQLHDGASLRLSALALRLGLLRDRAPSDETEWHTRIGELQEELHTVLQELRDVAGQIYPPVLDQAGLGPALRALADRTGSAVQIEVTELVRERRFAAALEVGAYFAVAACLSARAGEDQPLRITIDQPRGELVLTLAGVCPDALPSVLDQARPLDGTADLVEDGTGKTGTIIVRFPCE